MQGFPNSQTVKGKVKLKAPTSGGHKGGAKVDPTVPPSPSSQFDEMFHTLASNSVSLETKQRAICNCPSVTLDIQGKGVPSLLDLGSMVTLIWEGYFEKNILPLLKTSPGELIKHLGFSVPHMGFLVVKDPNTLIEPHCSAQLLGIIGCDMSNKFQ